MAARRKRKKWSPAKQARRTARQVVGQPKAGRILASKRRKPPKHRESPLKEFLRGGSEGIQ